MMAEGFLRNIMSAEMGITSDSLDEFDVVVRVSRAYFLDEAPDHW